MAAWNCLALRFQGSFPPVTITMFLTWSQHAAIMLSWWAGNNVVAVFFTGRNALPVAQPAA